MKRKYQVNYEREIERLDGSIYALELLAEYKERYGKTKWYHTHLKDTLSKLEKKAQENDFR